MTCKRINDGSLLDENQAKLSKSNRGAHESRPLFEVHVYTELLYFFIHYNKQTRQQSSSEDELEERLWLAHRNGQENLQKCMETCTFGNHLKLICCPGRPIIPKRVRWSKKSTCYLFTPGSIGLSNEWKRKGTG